MLNEDLQQVIALFTLLRNVDELLNPKPGHTSLTAEVVEREAGHSQNETTAVMLPA